MIQIASVTPRSSRAPAPGRPPGPARRVALRTFPLSSLLIFPLRNWFDDRDQIADTGLYESA